MIKASDEYGVSSSNERCGGFFLKSSRISNGSYNESCRIQIGGGRNAGSWKSNSKHGLCVSLLHCLSIRSGGTHQDSRVIIGAGIQSLVLVAKDHWM